MQYFNFRPIAVPGTFPQSQLREYLSSYWEKETQDIGRLSHT